MEPDEIEKSTLFNKYESGENTEDVRLIDVYTEDGMARFSDDVSTADGRCLVLVHPFYNFDKTDSIDSISDPEKRRYIESLRDMLQKNQRNGVSNGKVRLPVMIFAGGANQKTTERKTSINTERTQARLGKQLHDLLGLEGDFYFILTRSHEPYPLGFNVDDKDHKHVDSKYTSIYPTLINRGKREINFFVQLKKAGLKHAVVGGENFGGSGPFFTEKEYAPADQVDSDETYSMGSGFPPRVLGNHYEQRTQGKDHRHPLEVIKPEGCVIAVVKNLLFTGIDADLSQVTYPVKLPVTSQINPDLSVSSSKR